MPPAVRAAFANQAKWCAVLGSPFTASLMSVLMQGLTAQTSTGRRVFGWPGEVDGRGDAVPLRLAGALHALVRNGRLPALAAHYPPHPPPDEATLREVVMLAIGEADAEIDRWLDHPPQTNEVARSAILYPALMVIARETGLPLSLFEIGASAGLNLLPDRYAYRLGDARLGDPKSDVVLSPDWVGTSPGGPEPRIAARHGCDLNPIRIADDRQRERLFAYVWPDQHDRLARLEAAVAIARTTPVTLEQSDAVAWLGHHLADTPAAGTVRVVFHSITVQYFDQEARRRLADVIEAAGRMSTADRPLAWLSFEQSDQHGGPILTLRLWPDGAERVLARADAHARRIEWLL